jgi:hypothetical protein
MSVQYALTKQWSDGRTEGQINCLKTLKRAMYGRAGPEILGARMLPLIDCRNLVLKNFTCRTTVVLNTRRTR